jgi:hypothetical protein
MENRSIISKKMEAALDDFLKSNHRLLLKVDVNEQALTGTLRSYLETHFSGYDVDCEYNRIGKNGDRKKIFDTRDGAKPKATRNVKPDIIIHHRTQNGGRNNLVVIEAKKSGRDDSDDRVKLEAYKRELGYKYAFLVTFPKGNQVDHVTASSCIESI